MRLARPMDALLVQLRYTHGVVNSNLEDVDAALYDQAPGGGGNTLNWTLGHMVQARNGCLRLLGKEPVLPQAELEPYARGTAPAASSPALQPAVLLEAFNNAQEPLLAGLAALEQVDLDAPAPTSPVGNPDETVGSLLAGLVFHEAYHAGQLGSIRRALGLDGAVA